MDPNPGVDVDGDPSSSPRGTFAVSATIDNANNFDTLRVTRGNTVLLADTAFPITAHWGFSPDENRLAVHAVATGTQEDEVWAVQT